MGTTLTGTTPQDTYDSLIKVTDNGPLSGTLKRITDGLGNDSALSLSTGAASITGTLAVSSSVTLENGTIGGTDAIAISAINTNTNGTTFALNSAGSVGIMTFLTASAERMRITSDGYVRLAASAGGIQFNGDTAAANALDDYEEGTWTPSISFGGAAVGVTLNAANAASYTKIGRQVTVNGYLILTSKGSSTGTARLTGLPFTVANTNGTYSAATLRFQGITFTNQFQGFANVNTTTVEFEEITLLGAVTNITNADFANNSQIIFSLTYFV
jgi:hypothetical protein